MSGRWSSSNRRAQLPSDWAKRRAQVKARAHGRCQAQRHVDSCDGIGTDCDHIADPNDHSLDNLQWLSGPCHKAKTQAEAQRSRGVGGKRRARPHPSGVAQPGPPAAQQGPGA